MWKDDVDGRELLVIVFYFHKLSKFSVLPRKDRSGVYDITPRILYYNVDIITAGSALASKASVIHSAVHERILCF